MRVCAVVKYPPIQGGVSARCFWTAHALAALGHQVDVVTNAGEVEADYRLWIPPEDRGLLNATYDNGGRVTVVSTGLRPRELMHIPQSDPFVTKLSGLATEQIRREDCDMVFSYYYEPYGMSAGLASLWTGVPHVVQHAGSDRGRLMQHPELSTAYREMLRRAAVVVTPDPAFEGLGVPGERMVRAPGAFLPRRYFTPAAEPLDVQELIARLAGHPMVSNTARWRPDVPPLGVLGKAGEVKGSYDLISALARLRERHEDFNLLAMVAGRDRTRFLSEAAKAGISDRTWTLPLLPHWRVPGFLRACTAVCHLERGFPIAAHRPGIPQEILACGVCAVLSREVADKQMRHEELRDGESAFIVEDPTDREELAGTLRRILRDPGTAAAVGARGTSLVSALDEHGLGTGYESVLRRATEAAHGTPHRPADAAAPPADTAVPLPAGHPPTAATPHEHRAAVRAFLLRHAPATLRAFPGLVEEALGTAAAQRTSGPGGVAHDAHGTMELLWTAVSVSGDGAWSPEARMLCFERDLLWLAVDLEGPAGIPQFPRACLPTTPDGSRGELAVPVRSNWLRIAEHPRWVESAVAAAARGQSPGAVSDGPAVCAPYVFHKRGDLSPHVFRVNAATRALLELCDGSRTVADVRRAVTRGSRPGSPSVEAPAVHEVITALCRERLLLLL